MEICIFMRYYWYRTLRAHLNHLNGIYNLFIAYLFKFIIIILGVIPYFKFSLFIFILIEDLPYFY